MAEDQAGLPQVFNVVTTNSPADVGGTGTGNPIVRKLSFTGSTRVGKLLMEQSPAQTQKRIELGGNAPFIVFDDADIDAAVDGAIASNTAMPGRPACAPTDSTPRKLSMTNSWKNSPGR